MNLWEGLEVTVNQHLSLFARNVQTLCQAKDGDAIDNAEVGPFRLGTFVACDLVYTFLIYIGGSSGMKVFAFFEHLNHLSIL